MAWKLHAIEQTQLRRQHRVDGVGRPKFDFHTGGEDLGEDAVAGPLWAGPLHNFQAIAAMRADAVQRGWVGDRGYGRKLARLLDTLYDESRDADLDASLFISLDDVARRAGVRTPSKGGLVAALDKAGFRAASTHVEGKAVKTDAPMAACISAARVADAARGELTLLYMYYEE